MKRKGNRYRVDKAMRWKKILSRVRAVCGAFVALASIILLSAVLAHAYFALLDAPWLRVEEVEIVGLERVSREEILNAMEVTRETSVLNLNLSQLTRRLESLPWLRSALVRIETSGRLVVEVEEREPLAMVAVGKHFLVMDCEGRLVAHSTPEQHPEMMVIWGISDSPLEVGDGLQPDALEAVKRLLAAVGNSKGWFPMKEISRFTWNPETGFVIQMGEKPISVQLGPDDLEEKFRRLHRILEVLTERRWLGAVTRIDLDYGHRAYVEGQFPSFKGI